jgi:hypothetical protein
MVTSTFSTAVTSPLTCPRIRTLSAFILAFTTAFSSITNNPVAFISPDTLPLIRKGFSKRNVPVKSISEDKIVSKSESSRKSL